MLKQPHTGTGNRNFKPSAEVSSKESGRRASRETLKQPTQTGSTLRHGMSRCKSKLVEQMDILLIIWNTLLCL
ncbi:hypothetical protein DPMN_148408 [Dreissena polymorpha]|uniref:Uncharacterized protein n=1 Tax=Dreissena polymorpha TaxID=45954 RepID=A0A9D4J1H9_DREPO|nr:hypothetical protein DPMN_148408 [Dreissena polymorpha]